MRSHSSPDLSLRLYGERLFLVADLTEVNSVETDFETTIPHILGCSDLDRGIAFMKDHTGVRAAFGGIHPGRGRRNALLGLGYLRAGEYHVWLATEMHADFWDDREIPQGQIVTIVQGDNPPLRVEMPAVK